MPSPPPPAARRLPLHAWHPLRALRQRLAGWWLARLPATDHWTLGQRNVYILPTRAGLLFAATLLVMLVASVNYQLSLGYALTFLLAGAGAASMHLTHGNLSGLTLRLRPAGHAFAGEPVRLEVVIDNPGAARHGLALGFEIPGTDTQADTAAAAWSDVTARGRESLHLQFRTAQRGWNPVPVLRAHTVFPLGLLRSWTLWRPALQVLAYPRPEVPAPPLPAAGSASAGEQARPSGGGGELEGVRPWRRGDTLRQVAWKKVAHTGEMVSRDTTGAHRHELWLDWQDAAGTARGIEPRLSRLCAWALAAHHQGLRFGVRLPDRQLDPGEGEAHLHEVLMALALHR